MFDQQALQADYNLRVATKALDSDYAYTRHRWEVRYTVAHGRQIAIGRSGGGIHHWAGAFIRAFSAWKPLRCCGVGTSGDLDPLGGSRVVYNSVEYRYGFFEAFYDAGAVWDPGQDMVVRHSVGVGVRKNSVLVATAFPDPGWPCVASFYGWYELLMQNVTRPWWLDDELRRDSASGLALQPSRCAWAATICVWTATICAFPFLQSSSFYPASRWKS